jgi:hypothetical protein
MGKIPKIMWLAIILTAVTIAPYILVFHDKEIVPESNRWADFGTYMTGLLGPFFGLITIYLLVDTLNTQKKQIASADAAAAEVQRLQQRQQTLMQRQSFEQTFFSWLHSYRDLVSTISVRRPRMHAHDPQFSYMDAGRLALVYIWDENMTSGRLAGKSMGTDMEHYHGDMGSGNPIEHENERRCVEDAIKSFRRVLATESHNLDSMFHTLYQLLRWIDGSMDLRIIDKHKYIGIARAQVSNVELKMLFYYCLTGNEQLCHLVNKYGFLNDSNFTEPLFEAVCRNPIGIGLAESAFDADLAMRTDIREELARANHP